MEEWGQQVWFGYTITMRPCMRRCQGRDGIGCRLR